VHEEALTPLAGASQLVVGRKADQDAEEDQKCGNGLKGSSRRSTNKPDQDSGGRQK